MPSSGEKWAVRGQWWCLCSFAASGVAWDVTPGRFRLSLWLGLTRWQLWPPQTALVTRQSKRSWRISHNSHTSAVPFLGNYCILKGKRVLKGEIWVQLRILQRKSIIQTSSWTAGKVKGKKKLQNLWVRTGTKLHTRSFTDQCLFAQITQEYKYQEI